VTKNSEPFPVPVSEQLCAILKKLFRTGSVFDTTNFRKAFQAACIAVMLGTKVGPVAWQYRGLKPYDLRRSAVRNLSRAGVHETVAMKISGHKTRSVFDRYNITSLDDVKEAMGKVSRRNASLIQAVKKQSVRIVVNASVLLVKAEVAQLVEQPIRNRQVPGSSPGLGSRFSAVFYSKVVYFSVS